jgi:hypothetical protein
VTPTLPERYRWPLAAVLLLAAGLGLTLYFGASPPAPPGRAEAERAARRVLEGTDPLGQLCRGSGEGLEHACRDLREAQELERRRDPLAAATRLHDLASGAPPAGSGPVEPAAVLLARAERVRLLAEAGHSRQAAYDARRWTAEPAAQAPSTGAVRLWLEAALAFQAAGEEEQAKAAYARVMELAPQVR